MAEPTPARSAPVPEAGLTTGAVARALGVSPTTVRSWDRRYGIGPAGHSGGRHRRWSAADIAVLEQMCRLTASGVPPAEAARAARAAASGPDPNAGRNLQQAPEDGESAGDEADPALAETLRREGRGLARAAARLDADAVEDLLASILDRYGLVTAWEGVIMPTLHAVGRRWEKSGERYVEVEHLLSWHVSTALRRVRRTTAAAQRPPVVLACLPDEVHSLPLEALAAGLAQRGLPVRMFGASVPVDALEEAVRRTGPFAVVLWAQSRARANRPLVRHVGALEWGVRGARGHPTVLVAGPGWAGPPVPGARRPHGLAEALDMLTALAGP